MRKNEYAAVILADTQERCQRILQTMRDARLDALYLSSLDREVRPGNIIITEGTLQNGFELTNCKTIIFTDAEIYGSQKKGRKHQVHRQQSKLAAFADLNVGDYVVHVNHGIGIYQGVQKLEVAGIHKDYLLVKYAGEDRLYVPNEQVGMLQKYLGAEGQKPKLSKLGGTEWSKVKSRVKESVQSMAQDLIQLYADRQSLKGFAFGPDTVWQQEFEETFPYEETPDQIQAVAEIKTNMELPKPMDRLLCGDVGYGKTEVAIRAAFKAVMEGKQVAVLVPTTILAQQHFNTFHQRFANFPVTIEMLSRFRSPKEQRQTLSKMLQGQVDIVIGTHRLVQEDIVFKDLGLVIVDEEQRFGVAHKERLKQLRHSVDVLTLTATPIPRTLHMSLVGVRDMSLLETPPEDRYPVQTYVVEFNYQVIRDAILRELNRGGQTYFVHNRVMDIERVAEALQEIIPEARIAVAHGQMKEDDLERIMLDFLEGEFDVLLCTTIIETGLDIPNVNTIIIDEADHMGLSQLYQLRGRVGRSNRLAYAYLTYKRDKILTEIAEKRLQAIREFTEFGSGFKIAMRDLEIRGAGNILGPEQHGQIMSVGFEMYCRLLEEAVQELQGKQVTDIQEPAVEIAIDAFISDDYIPDQIRKMEMYRKIMLSRLEESVDEVVEELVDRFGDPPQAVQNLLIIARIKALCYELGLAGVTLSGEYLTFKFNEKPAVSGQQLVELAGTYRSLSFVAAPQIQMKLRIRKLSPEKVINEALGVLTQIKKALANQPG
jgi:transcription-repair coupling factor (superfamily II helicase)